IIILRVDLISDIAITTRSWKIPLVTTVLMEYF
ncbi:unnamed protein product, partial [marine sediment metagenome]